MLHLIRFQCAEVCISIGLPFIRMFRYLIISDLRKIRLGPVLSERVYCTSRGMFVRYRKWICNYLLIILKILRQEYDSDSQERNWLAK
jgi:hypothetical protein